MSDDKELEIYIIGELITLGTKMVKVSEVLTTLQRKESGVEDLSGGSDTHLV